MDTTLAYIQQNPQSARRNNVPGEQISRRFLLLSGNLSASNYPGPAYIASKSCSVANYRKQESLDSQVLDFPTYDFRILPRKGNFATEPRVERADGRSPSRCCRSRLTRTVMAVAL